MGQMKYLLLLALLVLSFLSAVLGEPLSYELCPCPGDAADRDNDTGQDEQVPIPSSPSPWLTGVIKRRVDLPTLQVVTRRPLPHPPGPALGHFGPSAAALIYHAAPLYQTLQVYRV